MPVRTEGAPVTETSAAPVGAPTAADPGAPLAPAIELSGVAKEFHSRHGNVQAVQRVDLSILQGEFFSLLGPSGCGKTTTLRMIAGFEEPTRGEILLYGDDVTDVPPAKRDVNMVFQSYALFPHMSVFDNVAFGLRRRRVDKAQVMHRVSEMLALVELGGREHGRPAELSGGQQQRVALARALVNRPRALLLDEPLGALDLKLRQAMQIELKRIQREVGITFVYVTHDQGEALTMSDRLVVMNDGRLEQLGPPREIYERPRTRFVAGFIGTSNILTAVVKGGVGELLQLDSAPDERLLTPAGAELQAGDRIDVTVRPEKISLASASPVDGCALRGTVAEIVYLGTSTNYTIQTRRGETMVAFRQNMSSSDSPIERGDEVWICWSPEHTYVLPGEPMSEATHEERDDGAITSSA